MVSDLAQAMGLGEAGIAGVRALVRAIVRDEAWRGFATPAGEEVTWAADQFADFVQAPLFRGLHTTVSDIEYLIGDDMRAVDALHVALRRPPGRRPRTIDPTTPDTVMALTKATHGNSRAYALRRLRVERPDLHARVLDGAVSVHAAMLQAGFRTKAITLPIDGIRAAGMIRRAFSPQELALLVDALVGPCGGGC